MKINAALIIDDELSVDASTLTPSLKLAPNNVIKKYKDHLRNLYGDKVPVDEEIFVVKLNKGHLNHKELVQD